MKTEYRYQIGDDIKTVILEPAGDRVQVSVDAKVYSVAMKQVRLGYLSLEVDGQQHRVHVAHTAKHSYVSIDGRIWLLEQLQDRSRSRDQLLEADASLGSLAAAMPGQVLDVLVAEGDEVERGQTLALLEAMKMELRITAPCPGRVCSVHCRPGQIVERGQVLVELEAI